VALDGMRITDNGNDGVRFAPSVAAGSKLTMRDVSIARNADFGVYIGPNSVTADVALFDSTVAANRDAAIYATASADSTIRAFAQGNRVRQMVEMVSLRRRTKTAWCRSC
jgi:hypothetical protein